MQQKERQPLLRNLPRHGIYGYFLIGLLLLALYLVYLLVTPFYHTIMISIVVAVCCYPLYKWFLERFNGKSIMASSAVLGVLVICFGIPVAAFLSGLIPQAIESVQAINHWVKHTNFEVLLKESGVVPALEWLQAKLPFVDPSQLDIKTHIAGVSKTVGQSIVSVGTMLLGDTVTFFFQFLLMLLIVFFLLKDGHKMIAGIKYLCPMREEQEDLIIHTLRRVSRAVLVGGLLVAMLQGVVGGVGLAIVGIPALFWGTVMGFCSLIPIVGTGLVWIPAAGYLLIVGQWKSALFLLLWCALPVAAIDSFLRPYFMKGSSGVSVFFIFMSILGGIKAFGMLGILYGPLILSFAVLMLTIYGEEFQDVLGEKPSAK